jgi:hypothetical protein
VFLLGQRSFYSLWQRFLSVFELSIWGLAISCFWDELLWREDEFPFKRDDFDCADDSLPRGPSI